MPLSLVDRVQATGVARCLYPVPVAASVARRRAARQWERSPKSCDRARRAMELLVGGTVRAPEVEVLAERHLYQQQLYRDLLWRERLVCGLPVEHVDRLKAEVAAGSGVVMSFLHQGQFNGVFASVARLGVPMVVVANPLFFHPLDRDWTGRVYAQQRRLIGLHDSLTVIDASGSFDRVLDLLRGGAVVALAADLPGGTPVDVLGRTFGMVSGAARAALATGAAIVPVTGAREGHLHRYTVGEPLRPEGYEDPQALVQALWRHLEPAVLAWPEAVEGPLWQYRQVGVDAGS